tara:strand:+ start:24081 stop:24602 length:522 start_codon:yes stop_codon:yes gene_type:complete
MTVHDFAFVVDADPHSEDFEDRFIEAGCDDATFILRRGAAVISFDREAKTFKDAVLSAYQQILSTGVSIIRFEPDFLVSAADIAARSGLTKAAISNFMKGDRRRGFPAPNARVEARHPLWDWVEVSAWMHEQQILPAEVHCDAMISRIINLGSQINHIDPSANFDVIGKLQAA